MNALRLTIMICGITYGVTSLAGTQCTESFLEMLFYNYKIERVSGKRVPVELIANDLPYSKLDYKVLKLGEGSSGSAYRIMPKKDPTHSFVVKKMQVDMAVNDYVAFEFLREISKPQKWVKIPKVKLLKVASDEPRNISAKMYMQLEDVKGTPLYQILSDADAPPALRKRLTEKYEKYRQYLNARLKGEYGMLVSEVAPKRTFFVNDAQSKFNAALQPKISWGVQTLEKAYKIRPDLKGKLSELTDHRSDLLVDGPQKHSLDIILKSDNIIVTPDEEFYLIDPF